MIAFIAKTKLSFPATKFHLVYSKVFHWDYIEVWRMDLFNYWEMGINLIAILRLALPLSLPISTAAQQRWRSAPKSFQSIQDGSSSNAWRLSYVILKARIYISVLSKDHLWMCWDRVMKFYCQFNKTQLLLLIMKYSHTIIYIHWFVFIHSFSSFSMTWSGIGYTKNVQTFKMRLNFL